MIKKNPGTSAAPGSALYRLNQPHDGTALSGRSRRMFSVIKLISCFFIFIFYTFFLRVFFNIVPVFSQIRGQKIFFIFLFPVLDMLDFYGILESVLKLKRGKSEYCFQQHYQRNYYCCSRNYRLRYG